MEVIKKAKLELINIFKIVDIGLIYFYLDFKVDKNCENKIIKFSQLA